MATPGSGPQTAVQIRRTFTAPREKVFQAWLDPKLMTRWFGRGVKEQPDTRIVELDARTGGHYKVEITPPAGHKSAPGATRDQQVYRMQGKYREVSPHDRLVFTWWWEGADFRDSVVTVEFRSLGQSNFTEVLLTHELLPEKEREDHRKGWEGCFNMLEEELRARYDRLDTVLDEMQNTPPAVVVRRTFAAPRDKVFQAWTDPKLMSRWFCRCLDHPETRVLAADARVGGQYRLEVEADKLYRGHGEYREVRPPEKLAFTWNWEHDEFQNTLVTVEFRALGESGFTEVTLTHEMLPTQKARDEHHKGWIECFEMLDRSLRGEEF